MSPTLRTVILIVALLVLVLRIHHCLQLPANTGDLLRHVYYGLAVHEHGLEAANITLQKMSPALEHVSWSHIPFNYPIAALLFDAGIVRLSPTLFAYKLALTMIEALTAILIFLFTKDKLIGLLYWASPVSIWWVSREGQFEPLHNLLTIAALILLYRKQWWAWSVLALAIQAKAFAFFLLPLFFIETRRAGQLRKGFVYFLMGFLPTIISAYTIDIRNVTESASLHFSPYYWNVFDESIFAWMPCWLVASTQLATYGWLAVLAILVLKEKSIAYAAPLGFLAGLKIATNVQFWYVNVFTIFLLPIEKKPLRVLLVLAVPLLDPYSALQLLAGPFGYLAGNCYDGLTVFTRLVLPL